MHWKAVSTVSLRLEFVRLAMTETANIRSLCRRFEISPKTAYKWIERYRQTGVEGLVDRSRRPRHTPYQTGPENGGRSRHQHEPVEFHQPQSALFLVSTPYPQSSASR